MRYSWAQFAIGVILGAVAVSLLFVTTSYLLLALLLLFVSTALMAQAPESAGVSQPPTSASSDLEEWRRFSRDVVKGFPTTALNVVVVLVLMYLWDYLVRRSRFLSELRGESVVTVVVAAFWLLHVVAAFRKGRAAQHTTSDGN